jgi:hypothetical protein
MTNLQGKLFGEELLSTNVRNRFPILWTCKISWDPVERPQPPQNGKTHEQTSLMAGST